MATDAQTATALLDEAAAIVEAEWMRLEQDADLWGEVDDPFAEMPVPRPYPPRVGLATSRPRRSGRPLPGPSRCWASRGCPAMQIWATQRSPPRVSGVFSRRCRTREVMPRSDDTGKQRLACRPL
jgi:hypothetical protein